MTPLQVCVDQIPVDVRASASTPPPVRMPPAPGFAAGAPPAAGLYVRIAAGLDPPDAVKAALAFVESAGSDRPRFVRSLTTPDGGARRIQLFGGPFPDEAAARGFCARHLRGAVCVLSRFRAGEVGEGAHAPDALTR